MNIFYIIFLFNLKITESFILSSSSYRYKSKGGKLLDGNLIVISAKGAASELEFSNNVNDGDFFYDEENDDKKLELQMASETFELLKGEEMFLSKQKFLEWDDIKEMFDEVLTIAVTQSKF